MPNQAFIDAYETPKPAAFSGRARRRQAVQIDDALRELRGIDDDSRTPDERADALVDVIADAKPRLLVRRPRPTGPLPQEFEDEHEDDDSGEGQAENIRSIAMGPVPAFLRKQREPVVEETPTIRMDALGDLSASAGISVDIPEDVLAQTQDAAVTLPIFPRADAEPEADESAPADETEETITQETESGDTADEADDEEGVSGGDVAEGLLPMYQVDHLAWPKACDLFERRAGEQLDLLTASIETMVFSGTRYLGFASFRPDEGCTTVLAATARRLAGTGRKVAIVDADLRAPRLAEYLGLAVETGWEEVTIGRCGLEEALIESTGDGGLTLLPWCGPTLTDDETLFENPLDFSLFKTLGHDYDVVLFDLGAIGASEDADSVRSPLLHSDCVDAVVIVQDVRDTRRDQVLRVKESLETAGIRPAGIAENFVVR